MSCPLKHGKIQSCKRYLFQRTLQNPVRPLPELLCHAHLPQLFRLFATLWTVARQASLSMEFFRKNTGVGSPYPLPFSRGYSQLRDQTHVSWVSCIPADSLLLSHWGSPNRITKNRNSYLWKNASLRFSK